MKVSLCASRPILLGLPLGSGFDGLLLVWRAAGSRKGHNPVKPGRPSHHPLVGWLNEQCRFDSQRGADPTHDVLRAEGPGLSIHFMSSSKHDHRRDTLKNGTPRLAGYSMR